MIVNPRVDRLFIGFVKVGSYVWAQFAGTSAIGKGKPNFGMLSDAPVALPGLMKNEWGHYKT